MRPSRRLSILFAGVLFSVAAVSPGRAQTSPSSATAPTAPEIAARQATAKEARRQKVAALVADARKLYDATQFHEAADLLRQATIIDPQDENAALELRLVMDKITARTYEESIAALNARQQSYVGGVAPGRIETNPYPPFGPTNDAARTELAIATDPPANRAARDRLEENLKEITADNQGLEKVLNFLRDNMGANIFVNWTALAAVNIDRNTPVSISLKEVPFRKALTTILSIVGGNGTLTYTIDDGIIVISTKEDFNSAKYQLIKVYDIRDLLVVPAEAVRGKPENDLFGVGYDRPTAPPTTAPGGLFADSGQGTQPESAASLQRRKNIQSIIDTLTKTVAPDTWRDKGGTIGSIRELNGQFIVNQTLDNQVAIYNLLNQLRDARVDHITLESRILLVPANFLDAFKIGWNIPELPPPPPAAPATPVMSATPPGVPGTFSFGTGPGAAAALLDNPTLTQILQAAQSDRRTVAITAPRCTIADGVEGILACAAKPRYISGYERTKPPIEPALFRPVYATVDTGLTMAFQPKVSPDHQSLVAHIEFTRVAVSRVERIPYADAPPGRPLEIEKPVLFSAVNSFEFSLASAATTLINLGPVPADCLRNAPDTEPDAPKSNLQLLLLVRPTVIPKSVEGQTFEVPAQPTNSPAKP